MFARAVMVVVNEFVVCVLHCVVVVALITAWNAPSKFILKFYDEEVIKTTNVHGTFHQQIFPRSVQTNEAKFRSANVTLVSI